jgi:hypothetical protein
MLAIKPEIYYLILNIRLTKLDADGRFRSTLLPESKIQIFKGWNSTF